MRTTETPRFFIGVDIESIAGFNKLGRRKDKGFLAKIFSSKELAYCYAKKNPAQHLAVRFAGKEAVNKALAGLDQEAVPLNQIEILHNRRGVPTAWLKNYSIQIRLSHGAGQALAFAIVFVDTKE